MKKIYRAAIYSLVLFTTSFLIPADGHAETRNIIKIGWIGPLTGNSAVLGIDSVQAAQLAIDEINNQGGIDNSKVELLIEDDQYETAKSLSAYHKLISKGVSALLVSTYGAVFALNQKALKDNVVIINPLDCNNDIAALSENIFCIATESESIGREIADHIIRNSLTPVAVMFDERNPFMTLVANVIKSRFDNDNKFIFQGIDQNNTSGFQSLLLKHKAAAVKSIVFLGHDPMGQAMKEARNLGIQSQFYTVGTITSPGFQKLAGEAANNSYVAYWEASKSEQLIKFLERFKKMAGREPILQLATIPSFDSTQILLTSVKKSLDSSGKISTNNLKKELLSLSNYPGLSGSITMDSDGAVRTIRESIYQYNNGNLSADF